jgi:hypothetical protein
VARVDLKGVHRVRKVLANGEVREYHYVFRGGPKFWDSTMAFRPGDPDYAVAYVEVEKGVRLQAKVPSRGLTAEAIDRFISSAQFTTKAERTQKDYRKYLDAFAAEFGEDPIKMFEEREVLSEISAWKNKWAHSPKQYDYATTVVTRFLNWCEGASRISGHHHKKIARLYGSNRAEIIWLPEEVAALRAVATPLEARVLDAASEGGLTPQDIGILTHDHVQRTPRGRRLLFRRTKSGKLQSIPVTPTLGRLIDTTPEGQNLLVPSLTGQRLTAHRASQIIRDLKDRANAKAKKRRTGIHVRDELRLYDMRGTAATELLRAGCSLNEIAVTMGWGLRHAANIIEKYAAVVPEVSDEVLAKLIAARKEGG